MRSAADLLRLVFAWGLLDWSLRSVAAWAEAQGLASLSAVALRKRLLKCEVWLGELLQGCLERRWGQQRGGGLRLRDASCVSQPGSKGTDWRLHLSLNLGQMGVDGLSLTDQHGGESFAQVSVEAGDLCVGDAGYAYVRSLVTVLLAQGLLLVRMNWQNLPLFDAAGRRFDLLACLRRLNAGGPPGEFSLGIQHEGQHFPLRLLVLPLPQEKAELARQRLQKRLRKKGKTASADSLLAAGFVLLLTNLSAPTWSPQDLFALYRLRWQIELYFKRLKSLLHLDQLRCKHPTLVRVYLLTKLLAAVLLDEASQRLLDQAPLPQRPPSRWRLTQLLFRSFCEACCPTPTLDQLARAWPRLLRHLTDPPRRRPLQLSQYPAPLAPFLAATQLNHATPA